MNTIDAIEITPGNTSSRTSTQAKTLATQELFLSAYIDRGTIAAAAEVVGIHRTAATWWQQHDHLGFRDRFKVAVEAFADRMEQLAIDRVAAQGPRDNPLLHITLLNAHKPEKYRPRSAPANEIAKELMNELKRLRQEERAQSRLESGTVEGEVTG